VAMAPVDRYNRGRKPWQLEREELRFDFGTFEGTIRVKSGYYQRVQNQTITNDDPRGTSAKT